MRKLCGACTVSECCGAIVLDLPGGVVYVCLFVFHTNMEVMESQNWDSIKRTALNKESVSVSSGKVTINNRSIFHRVVINNDIAHRQGNLLLLHAGCYSSQTWFDHGTMHVMANHGFRVAAIDMPGKAFRYNLTPSHREANKAMGRGSDRIG